MRYRWPRSSSPYNDPAHFMAGLKQIGWKQMDFARRFGLEPSTLTKWKQKGYVPTWAAECMALLVDLQRVRDTAKEVIEGRIG